jgi:hypothetical protein
MDQTPHPYEETCHRLDLSLEVLWRLQVVRSSRLIVVPASFVHNVAFVQGQVGEQGSMLWNSISAKYRIIFMLKFWIQFHPKQSDTNLFDFYVFDFNLFKSHDRLYFHIYLHLAILSFVTKFRPKLFH